MHKILFVWCILMFGACSKAVFIHADLEGKSKFILYSNKNYTYVEKTVRGRLKEYGHYAIQDSTLIFTYRNRERPPYTYQSSEIKVLKIRDDKNYSSLHVVDKEYQMPVFYCPLVCKDSSGQILSRVQTDFDGYILIPFQQEIHTIEVDYTGYIRHVLPYKKNLGKDIQILLEQHEWGGRQSEGCLIDFVNFVLRYSLNSPTNFTRFERNGVVYTKVVKRE